MTIKHKTADSFIFPYPQKLKLARYLQFISHGADRLTGLQRVRAGAPGKLEIRSFDVRTVSLDCDGGKRILRLTGEPQNIPPSFFFLIRRPGYSGPNRRQLAGLA